MITQREEGMGITLTHQASILDKSGGAEEDRTPDLCIANAALSQLSYGPVNANVHHDQVAKSSAIMPISRHAPELSADASRRFTPG